MHHPGFTKPVFCAIQNHCLRQGPLHVSAHPIFSFASRPTCKSLDLNSRRYPVKLPSLCRKAGECFPDGGKVFRVENMGIEAEGAGTFDIFRAVV